MPKARGVRIVQFLLGCALIVGSVLMLRLHLFGDRVGGAGPQPSRAVQTYRQRVRATQILLKTDRLELSSR